MAFVNQAVPDIRNKLRKIDRLVDKSTQELLAVAQIVYNWETPEDIQMRVMAAETAKQIGHMTRTLPEATAEDPDEKSANWDA